MEKNFMIWVGTLTGKSMAADSLAMLLLGNDLLKGIPFGLAILLFWLEPLRRVFALRIVFVALLSVTLARISQNFFYSPRPIMVEEIAASFSDYAKGTRLDWNSFPSDHLSLYFPIALMTLFQFRKLGIGLLIWSVIGVALPRIFFGRHYPSDILGGIAVGAITYGLFMLVKNKIEPTIHKVDQFLGRNPKTSHTLAFIICYQISTVFDSARFLGFTLKNIFDFYTRT